MTRRRIETFPLKIVLSAYHDRKLCRFCELQDFLSYVTGTRIYTREVPRARVAVAKYLDKQFPWLPNVDVPPNATTKTIREIARRIGTSELEVVPMRKGAYKPTLHLLEGLV